MTPYRKKKISTLADFISSDFTRNGITDLVEVAAYESLPIHLDKYENYFDGMLVHDGLDYHVHLNLDKGNTLTSKRGRFTLGHELGHFFIEEHRIGLKHGFLTPHPSLNDFGNSELIELEADYFSSCLLMPYDRYREFCARKPFCFDLLFEVSERFQASLVACLLRFVEAGTREFLVVVSQEKRIKWFSKSPDFPKFSFRFKVGGSLPKDSLSELYYGNVEFRIQSGIEESDPETWFFINDGRRNNIMYEQCYYSDRSQQLITLVWFR